MIWVPQTPDSLYIKFWGAEECAGIREKLKNIKDKTNEAMDMLKGRALLTKQEGSTNTSIRNRFKGIHRGVFRAQFVLMKKEYLRRIFADMEKAKKDINTMAKRGWRRPPHRRTEVDFDRVHNIGVCYLLVPLALKVQTDVNALAQSLWDAGEELFIELELNPFSCQENEVNDDTPSNQNQWKDSRYTQLAAIAEFAATGHLKLRILAQRATSRTTNLLTRVLVSKSSKSASESLNNAYVAIERVITNVNDEVYYSATTDTRFCVERSLSIHDRNEGDRFSLRMLLSKNSSPLYTRPDLLGRVSKYKIAFELSQACFLFLQSTWLRRLCSCCLQCGKLANTPEDEYECSLTVGHFTHHALQFDGAQVHEPEWCGDALI
jgi:hypothetical protein